MKRPPGFRSASSGVRALIRSKSSMSSSTPTSCAMASRCSTALVDPPLAATPAMAFSIASRVMIWLGCDVAADEFHHHFAGLAQRRQLLRRSTAGTPLKPMGEMPRNSHDGRHGVGRELAAAGAGAGTGVIFNVAELGVGHLAAAVSADGFEDVLNGDVVVPEIGRGDGAAVEHEAGNIEPGQRHDRAGDGLVAAGEGDDAVEEIAARDQFDGVGDHFAADERGLHALGAHGDAVGDGDGVELHGRAAGVANAFLHGCGEFTQVIVAGADFDPGVGDADDGLTQIFVGKADRLQHGAGGSAVGSIGDSATVALAFSAHCCSLGKSLYAKKPSSPVADDGL